MLCAPDAVVGVSIGIIVILFCVQSCGTGRVGPSFSPIVILWCAPEDASQSKGCSRIGTRSSECTLHLAGVGYACI